MHRIPQGDQERKDAPMYRGLLGYFPAALFEVAAHSLDSDRKHGGDKVPGAPHWMRGASTDHEDTIVRHLIDAGPRRLVTKVLTLMGFAPKGSSALDARRYHLRCAAWRALALLQEDCEAAGAQPGVSSVFPEPEVTYEPELPRDQIREDEYERYLAPSLCAACHQPCKGFDCPERPLL